MYKITKVFFLVLLLNGKAFGEDKNEFILEKSIEEKRAEFVLSNMQKDYIACYSFYKIGAEYVRKTNGDENIIEGIERSSDTSLKLAHETGEIIGMTSDEMSIKVKSEMKNQLDLINNNFKNAEILLKKYSQNCKNLIEDKKKRIFFWEKKALEKFK
tara:strand:- start:166 stop:636 length:471 start_codon:yes stop_codon:yes gene_type:complete